MFRSFRLGTLFGFPVHVNLTFLLLLGVVGLTMGGAAAIAVVLLAFASVLLHELGHAVVARHLGVRIDRIELHFFGGAAQMTDHPRSAGDEVAIAAAGPAVSFALAGLSALLASATALPVFGLLAQVNLVLGAFNLLPALPMDGGRILRALLSRRMGYVRATETAVKVTRVAAIGLGLIGVVTLHLYLVVLAVLLWMMGSAEERAAWTGLGDYPGAYAAYRSAESTDRGRAGPPWSWRAQPPRAAGGFFIRRDGHRIIVERVD
jgi:Zn-dependent protease